MPLEQSARAIRPEEDTGFDPDATKVRTLTRQNIEEMIAAAEYSSNGVRAPVGRASGQAAGHAHVHPQHAVPSAAASGIRELDETDLEEVPDATMRDEWDLPITDEATIAGPAPFDVREHVRDNEPLDRDGRVAPREQPSPPALPSEPPFARQGIAASEVLVFLAAFLTVAGPAFYWLMR